MTAQAGRVYAGRSGEQRRADRHRRLVATGLDLFGTEGWQAASIERLCAGASVATRSFYEEFPGREQLLREVYDEVVRTSAEAVLLALRGAVGPLDVRIAAGVAAYVRHLTEDPRRARVLYREARAVGGLEVHRHSVSLGVAGLLEAGLPELVLPRDEVSRRVLTLALAGALGEVIVDWVAAPEPRPPLDPLCEGLSRLFAAALVGPAAAPAAPADVTR